MMFVLLESLNMFKPCYYSMLINCKALVRALDQHLQHLCSERNIETITSNDYVMHRIHHKGFITRYRHIAPLKEFKQIDLL